MMKALLYGALWEGGWWVRRVAERHRVFALAQARAVELGLPLVVVGSPDSGPTLGPSCGDVTIDWNPQTICPYFIEADITKPIPYDGPAVVFVSCTLDYVDDLDAALANLRRIAGAEVYNVRVEPWTLVAHGIGYEPVRHVLPWPNGRIPA